MFKLVIQDDEGKTTVVPLIRDEITIGRKEGNTIRLTERNVSRRHARILRNNGEVQIEDLGSYNGIRVNNARIAERVSLRISDQVQIGDYKLYLKAEGVEQVDDARTMPIERIEPGVPTDAMPAVPSTPTAPMAAATPTATPAAPLPVVGQVRAQMGVADTDPAGRPVATAAQVAALTQPAGYGKLCVISSNFAGKEYDLTRPQMIIGRTDENDIVINHRSISRNHAKITRDPDTQRYTISDLQSSNGVRVNGQDYGKVELRRGDVVDLGHVRLRFVEPGEDFVFSRDAVIADVPETGGRKGLWVALLVALVLTGTIVTFIVMRGGDDKPQNSHQTGSNDVVTNDHNQVASGNTPDPNDHPGSNAIIETPADAAQQAVTPPPTNDAERIKGECLGFKADKKWQDLNTCADKLAGLDAATAKQLKATARSETVADGVRAKMDEELNQGNLRNGKKLLDQIGDDSTYKQAAQQDYDQAEQKVIDDFKNRAGRFAREKKCTEIDKLIAQAGAQSGKVADAVRTFKCDAAVAVAPPPVDCSAALRDGSKACKTQYCNGHPDAPQCEKATAPPPTACDFEGLKEKGMENTNMGQHAAALGAFEAALKCKPGDSYVISLAFMASCNSGNSGKAKSYYPKLSTTQQQRYAQMCARNKVPYQ